MRRTKKGITTFWGRSQFFHTQNIAAASIILSSVDFYGGEAAGLVIWARLTQRREEDRLREVINA